MLYLELSLHHYVVLLLITKHIVVCRVPFQINMNLLFSRSYTKNVEYFDFTNTILDWFYSTLYCLYVSIRCCSDNRFDYFNCFTNNTSRWKSSINCYCVKIKFIRRGVPNSKKYREGLPLVVGTPLKFSLFIIFFLKFSTSIYRISSWSYVDNSRYY